MSHSQQAFIYFGLFAYCTAIAGISFFVVDDLHQSIAIGCAVSSAISGLAGTSMVVFDPVDDLKTKKSIIGLGNLCISF